MEFPDSLTLINIIRRTFKMKLINGTVTHESYFTASASKTLDAFRLSRTRDDTLRKKAKTWEGLCFLVKM